MPSSTQQNVLALLGRLFVALLFIPAGMGKVAGFGAFTGYIASYGVPFPQACALVAIIVEVGLGLLLLFGWQARWAALGLAAFVVVITPIFHNFWALPEAKMMLEQQAFFKNVALVGGLLVIAAFGPGRWSLDARVGLS